MHVQQCCQNAGGGGRPAACARRLRGGGSTLSCTVRCTCARVVICLHMAHRHQRCAGLCCCLVRWAAQPAAYCCCATAGRTSILIGACPCLAVWLSACLAVCLSRPTLPAALLSSQPRTPLPHCAELTALPVCPSVCLSVCLPICLSACLNTQQQQQLLRCMTWRRV